MKVVSPSQVKVATLEEALFSTVLWRGGCGGGGGCGYSSG